MITEFTYTLEDLKQNDFPGTPLAVLGQPIAHSVSPAMHNAAISVLAEQNLALRIGPTTALRFLRRSCPRHCRCFIGRTFLV